MVDGYVFEEEPRRLADGDAPVHRVTLDADGSPRHFSTAHPRLSETIDQQGIDLLAPAWHVLDLTPRGRGDWYSQLDYSSTASAG